MSNECFWLQVIAQHYGGLLLVDIPAAVERFITEDLCRLNVASSHITNERIIMIVKVETISSSPRIKEIFISVTDNYLDGAK